MIRNIHTAQKLSLPPSRPVNMQLGSYEPCFEIGSGGMASVYIAREHGHSGLKRTVALKVMHEHLARRDEFKNRFLDEARVLTQIAHPFVCRVVGYGEDSGRPFMAMEYLIGEPLSRTLRAMKRRGQSLSTLRRARLFARVVADLAEGLHAAHEAKDYEGKPMGVVHRDITPHNLFLLYDGTVRVLDFGIARFADRNVHTVSNALLGKLPYMAPEQMQGEGYDRRVDVWALGVVLWELVTLGRLFKRETEIRTMRAVCTDQIPSLNEFAPDTPPGLQEVVDRALQRDPDERYPTARALSHALEMWLSASGPPVTHGETSEFLSGFFPGSQLERQRWAQQSSPGGSGVRRAIGNTPDDVSGSQLNPFAEEDRGEHEQAAASADNKDENENAAEAELEPATAQYINQVRSLLADPLPVHTDVTDEEGEVTAKREAPPLESDTRELLAQSGPSASSRAISDSTRITIAKPPAAKPTSRAGWLTTFAACALCVSTLGIAHLGQQHDGAAAALALQPEATPNVAAAASGLPAVAVVAPSQQAQEMNDQSRRGDPVEPGLHSSGPVLRASREQRVAALETTKQVGTNSSSISAAPDSAAQTTPPVAKQKRGEEVQAAKPALARSPERASIEAPPRATLTAPSPTGDVMIISSTPGVKVFLGSRLLGTTPVKTRLPAGPALLALQVGAASDRIPMSAHIAPGRLNMLSVNLSK